MYDQDLHDESDEYGFWANVPERRFSLPRLGRAVRPAEPSRPSRSARRTHGGRRDDSSAVAAAAVSPVASARSLVGHVDPLIRRSGTLALVITLFIPLALALRPNDQPQQGAALQPGAGAAAVAGVAGALEGSSAARAAGVVSGDSSVSADPYAGIDIAALPEAVPVNKGGAAAAPTPEPAAPADSQPAPVLAATATPTATTVVVATAQAEQAPTRRASCTNTYTVARGDAWVLIARKVGTTTKALLAANNATRRTALYPGRTVCLPKGAAAPAAAPAPTTTAKPPSTTAPAAPPTTVATRPANNYTKAQAEQIIRDVWPDNLEDHAVFIANRESHLTPNVNNFCCYGLFQIYYSVHKKWLAQIGVTSAAQLWDPRINAYAALVLYNRAGSFAPWGG